MRANIILKKKLKIAILTEIINNHSGSRAPLEIAKALKNYGDDVTVLAHSFFIEKEALLALKKSGINVILIYSKKPFSIFEVYRKIKNGDFDIVSFHGTIPSYIGALLARKPIVRTYHGTQLDSIINKNFPQNPSIFLKILNKVVNFAVWLNEYFMIINSARVLAISKYTQKELLHLYHYQAIYVDYGTAADYFKTTKPVMKKDNKEVIVLSVSRIIPYKGFHKLINIFNSLSLKYPQLRLVILGSFPQKNYLKYLKKISSEKVKILINVSDRVLVNHYRKADIYATFDNFLFYGMPILEAASFGLPVVSINKCAAPELIKHQKTGFLAASEALFEQHLEKLVKNKRLRQKMGGHGFRFAQTFSWNDFGERYHVICTEILKGGANEKILY